MSELIIPDEAEEFAFVCGCIQRCGRKGYELEGIAFIVAAELKALANEMDTRTPAYRVTSEDVRARVDQLRDERGAK